VTDPMREVVEIECTFFSPLSNAYVNAEVISEQELLPVYILTSLRKLRLSLMWW